MNRFEFTLCFYCYDMTKAMYNVLKTSENFKKLEEIQSVILNQEQNFNSKTRANNSSHHKSKQTANQEKSVDTFETNSVELRSYRNKRKITENFADSKSGIKMVKLDIADDIQQKLNDQIRMREGAMKLMSACSTLRQALETSKNLLTINARILGLMSALQKKKEECVLQEYNKNRTNSMSSVSQAGSCLAQVAISDIRVPLMWKDNVHFTGKTGDQSYYAFALIRCGDQVRDTDLYEITSSDTDMYFEEPLTFTELSSDFKMELEVYYTVITANERHGVRPPMRAPMQMRKRVINFNAPKFALAGHVQLTVDHIKAGMISKDLNMGGKGASGVAVLGDASEFPVHPLELWGQFCCYLASIPKCMVSDALNASCKVNGEEKHVVLERCSLQYWMDEESYSNNQPHVDKINITTSTGLLNKESELCIKTGDEENNLTFADARTCSKWTAAIENTVLNIQAWKVACEELMHIAESRKNKMSIPSKASFYDQIFIGEVSTADLLNMSKKMEIGTEFSEKSALKTSADTSPVTSGELEKIASAEESPRPNSTEPNEPIVQDQVQDQSETLTNSQTETRPTLTTQSSQTEIQEPQTEIQSSRTEIQSSQTETEVNQTEQETQNFLVKMETPDSHTESQTVTSDSQTETSIVTPDSQTESPTSPLSESEASLNPDAFPKSDDTSQQQNFESLNHETNEASSKLDDDLSMSPTFTEKDSDEISDSVFAEADQTSSKIEEADVNTINDPANTITDTIQSVTNESTNDTETECREIEDSNIVVEAKTENNSENNSESREIKDLDILAKNEEIPSEQESKEPGTEMEVDKPTNDPENAPERISEDLKQDENDEPAEEISVKNEDVEMSPAENEMIEESMEYIELLDSILENEESNDNETITNEIDDSPVVKNTNSVEVTKELPSKIETPMDNIDTNVTLCEPNSTETKETIPVTKESLKVDPGKKDHDDTESIEINFCETKNDKIDSQMNISVEQTNEETSCVAISGQIDNSSTV